MDIQRKTLFNLLRMNWLVKPTVKVAAWQVEDYRQLSVKQIVARLEQEEIRLTPESFMALAEDCESPEECTGRVLEDETNDPAFEDRVYLLIFELWRRLLPERTCLSIFCDELDFQINLYDSGDLANIEPLEDALANLQAVLDENTDLGNEPQEVFKTISSACANDIEDFIYDFIADQIDANNMSYASELLEGFYSYVGDGKWFDLLRIRVLFDSDPQEANTQLKQIIENPLSQQDLEFNLETLSLMVQGGERQELIELVKNTVPLIRQEMDLKELIAICADYYQRLDYDWEERALQELAKSYQNRPQHTALEPTELSTVRTELLKILKKRPIL